MTLDDDVAARLRAKARLSARPFKAVVNEMLRAGLDAFVESTAPFVVMPLDLRLRPGVELDSIEGLLDQIEGVDRR